MQPFYYSVYMLLLHTALITDVIQMIFTCLINHTMQNYIKYQFTL